MLLIEIKQSIMNDSQNKVRSYQEIADMIGVTKNTVTNTIKFIETGRPQTSLQAILGYHQLYASLDDHERTTIRDYVENYDLKSSHLKDVMDYCYENDYFEVLELAIKKSKEKPYEMSKVARLYELLAKPRMREISYVEAYAQSKKIDYRHPHVEILKRYLEIVYLTNEDDFVNSEEKCIELMGILQKSDPHELPVTNINTRVNVVFLKVMFVQQKYHLVRETGFKLLDDLSGNRFTAMVFIYIGLSYQYEDYHLAKVHFLKALEIYKRLKLKGDYIVTQRNLELTSVIFDRYRIEELVDSKTIAIAYCLEGRMREADKIVTELEKGDLGSPILLISRGLIELYETGRDIYLRLSKLNFEKCGDFHFAELPMKIKELFLQKRQEWDVIDL
ncbi:AimR family lysis-lysogeny pheromone receptor [Bacillus carboniphilus]|uniref:AimR family lysis-lysogeny pheromone receptor n=1 Tax=Bacillus carboniphilus TaxID=86663 RepID=A0ABY9JSN2_9BACI|nr:AimR family lysis-lysogeny pheromone receptor [Bacillus carboniphilus]WLR42415.1 AimR family lysis-lysogeny pheromone receptor [Bacillus carboniphilus]